MAAEWEYESVLPLKMDPASTRSHPRPLTMDHFKWVGQESEISKESQEVDTRPELDPGFKEEQIFKLIVGKVTAKKGAYFCPHLEAKSLFPHHSPQLPSAVTPPPIPKSNRGGSDANILLDLHYPAPVRTSAPAPVSVSNDLWGNFSSASSSVPNQAPQPPNWVQF
uniref:Uncharacterized protein n=1 Tax=Prolemur simus TaxID=1328070 RepID=A0A8C9AE45_PROSS